MGFNNGVNIVTDSMVFCLDAGNSKCFSDGNTTATCLVSGSLVTGASGNPGTGTHTPNTANFPAYSSIMKQESLHPHFQRDLFGIIGQVRRAFVFLKHDAADFDPCVFYSVFRHCSPSCVIHETYIWMLF